MIAQTQALDVRQYVSQYELLRAQVIGTSRDMALGREASQRRGIGLALLLREGMPGWLKAMEAVLRASLVAAPCEASGSGRTALEGPPSDAAVPTTSEHAQHHDITILLASLVLSTRHLPGLSPSEGGYRPCQ
jgi:hypothetical protein